ncbi:C-X-C motif chemokine 13-like isoform 1-T1 [Cyanocitta cristata]
MAVRVALLLGVLLATHHPGDTAILEANGNLSCRCLKSTRAFISPEKYSSVEVWPVGSSCRRLEVVIKLKSLKRVCVDPDTPWVKKLLQDLPHLSISGEPADQHEVQVHQIHCPRHQPGADPHHRRYPAGHSLQEEGDHPHPKEEQAGVRDPRGTLDPAAHPQADAEE